MSKYPPELISKLRTAMVVDDQVQLDALVDKMLEALAVSDLQYLSGQHGFHLISRDEYYAQIENE